MAKRYHAIQSPPLTLTDTSEGRIVRLNGHTVAIVPWQTTPALAENIVAQAIHENSPNPQVWMH